MIRSLTALALLLASYGVHAQTLPADPGLRIAYCLPVLTGDLALAQAALAHGMDDPALLAKTREKVTILTIMTARLQSYLAHRSAKLDPAAMALATQHGEADLAALAALPMLRPGQATPDQHALLDRSQKCYVPGWLPV